MGKDGDPGFNHPPESAVVSHGQGKTACDSSGKTDKPVEKSSEIQPVARAIFPYPSLHQRARLCDSVMETPYLARLFRKLTDQLGDQPLPVTENVHPVAGKDHLKGRIHGQKLGHPFHREPKIPQEFGHNLPLSETGQGCRIDRKGISRFPMLGFQRVFRNQDRFESSVHSRQGGDQRAQIPAYDNRIVHDESNKFLIGENRPSGWGKIKTG